MKREHILARLEKARITPEEFVLAEGRNWIDAQPEHIQLDYWAELAGFMRDIGLFELAEEEREQAKTLEIGKPVPKEFVALVRQAKKALDAVHHYGIALRKAYELKPDSYPLSKRLEADTRKFAQTCCKMLADGMRSKASEGQK